MFQPEGAIRALKLAAVVGILSLTQACATNFKFQVEVDDPEPSKEQFASQDQDQPKALAYSHKIPADHVHAKGSILNYEYQQNKKNIDTSVFFQKALQRELNARALAVSFDDQSTDQLELLEYNTIAHRNNGFSPLVTISMAKLDLTVQGKKHRIAAIIKRAKVPIWTVTEEPLVEATMNQPQELLVKEVAAKINLALFNNQLSDENVAQLVKDVEANINNEDLAYQKVYDLGFSNNPNALEALRKFSTNKAEYIRLAAISGMGMIGKDAVLEELKALYAAGQQWQDRAVALKAIGDIQSNEATAFLKLEHTKWQAVNTQEGNWNKAILSLYLD